MQYKVSTEGDLLYVQWSKKAPPVERDMHQMGGAWQDFNCYRFPLDEVSAKKVLRYAKQNGGLSLTPGAKETIKDMIETSRRAERLTRGDADAEVSELLLDVAPETAKALRPYQRAAVEFMSHNEATLLADDPGSGKAQPLSELVATPCGWRRMGDLRQGDYVLSEEGKPVEVLAVFPQGEKKVAKITFSDGAEVRCDWDHLWNVRNHRDRTLGRPYRTMTTQEIVKKGVLGSDGRKTFSIPLSQAVEYDERNFPIDPYTWGVLIGDGSISKTHWASITTDHEIVSRMDLPAGASAKLVKDFKWYGEYRLNGLSSILRGEGLNGKKAENKEIPEEILYGSIDQRVRFLQGLLDTDGGTVKGRDGGPSSSIEYGTVSEALAHQTIELVQSLGGLATLKTKDPWYTYNGEARQGQLFYRLAIQLPDGVAPFTLERKLRRWTPRSTYKVTRYIAKIEEAGTEECQCILVDSESHLYLTRGYAVTHNTLQTIASLIAADVRGDILVMAPSIAVQVAWPAEIARWSPGDEVLRVSGTRKVREAELAKLTRASEAPRRWVLCNIEMAKTKYHQQVVIDGKVRKNYYKHVYPELFYLNKDQKKVREWDAIVVDESHRALITKKSRSSDQTQTRCGMGKLKLKEGGKRIAISGTPFRGKPENLWGTLNWLFPEQYTSFWDWVGRWFETNSGFFGGTEISELQGDRKQEFYRAIQPFMLRRTKGEIAPDLPPKTYAGSVPPGMDYEPEQHDGLVGHWIEMSPKQKKAYEEMEEYATAALETGTLVANGVLSELTRLKQFATSYGKIETVQDSDGFDIPVFRPSLPSNKFDWLVEFLGELGIDGSVPEKDCRKVVVASQFTSIIDVFAAGLEDKGIDVLKITGKVNAKSREAAVQAFQRDDGPQVLMLNTMAGGVALTLDRADDIVILDETFIPDDQTQVEDRVHRVSRMHNVTVHYVRSIGTVEERIAKLTFDRNNLQLQLIDGTRGVSIARKLAGKG